MKYEDVAPLATVAGAPTNVSSGRRMECFVVMPYGRKPIPGSPGELFDFDRVYRVVMRRAIEAAGMVPMRSDESSASGVIHTEMFKALRDNPVVLAELSLHNPNVYYELGIRHVLSSSGTVLMCRMDQPLPFDVALSRVVMYEYDGQRLDWEEAERVIPILTQCLVEAQQGRQDSPVHALIHIPEAEKPVRRNEPDADEFVRPELHSYQKELGARWRHEGAHLPELMARHATSVFGARAVGYYCLAANPLPEGSAPVAAHLVDAAQYDLANELFERLGSDSLDYGYRAMYASSYSETHPNVAGADHALALVDKAIVDLQNQSGLAEGERAAALAECYRREAGLVQWRWQLTRKPADLDDAIEAMERALAQMLEARHAAAHVPAGTVTQVRIKLMLQLRIRDGDNQRVDAEQHGQAVLAITPDRMIDDENTLSWLRWYQVIVLADQGREADARNKMFEALREDGRLDGVEHWEVGRRQYLLLRRFIDQYAEWFRNPSQIGIVAQALQSRLDL